MKTLYLLLITISMYIMSLPQSAVCLSFDEQYYRNNSLLNYETVQKTRPNSPDYCFNTGKIVWNPFEYNTLYMPGTISKDNASSNTKIVNTAGFFVTMWLSTTPAFLFSPLFAAVSAVRFYNMIDACTNTYVVAPHEYFNQINGHKCELKDGVMQYVKQDDNKEPLTEQDMPFFYHCDPTYDPMTDSYIDLNTEMGVKLYGRTYGYMGANSEFCSSRMLPYVQDAVQKKLVGRIIVEQALGVISVLRSFNDDCSPDSKRWRKAFSTRSGEIGATRGMYTLTAYYKKFSEIGKIKMCVGTLYTLFPVRVACGNIAPPGDENNIDPRLKAYVQDTRCIYLIEPRKDLHTLGKSLPEIDESGASRRGAKLFLQSDFHVTSTVVGCIKDMLMKIFIKKNGGDNSTEKPFFQVVQERFKQIVLAVMVLYVSVVGLKIMSAAEQLKKNEVMMFLIKLSLVAYFAIGDGFYRVEPNGEVTGIFPQLMSVTDEIANMFLEAQNTVQSISHCKYQYKNKNLIGEHLYTGSLNKTVGFEGVKTTVWDLVDCKIISYFNAGSCDFTPRGMVAMWLVSIGFIGTTAFILSIVSLIYCMMLLFIIFEFTHIFILSAIIITILIFLSPLFIPFALFDVTKGIFQKWMTTILGYILYPALLFAFMALMLATFDQIYYGNLNIPVGQMNNFDIKKACEGVESIYCFTLSEHITHSNDACDLVTNPAAKWITTKKISYIGSAKVLVDGISDGLLPILLKLMLFAFLFYVFLGSVSRFMASLLSIQNLDMAKGSMNALDTIKGAFGMGYSGAKKLFSRNREE